MAESGECGEVRVQLADLDELVILDPEWLARVFTSVVAGLDSAVDERALIDRQTLCSLLPSDCSSDRVIAVLRHFQLCLPIIGTDYELFPCRLPFGQPDVTVWPPAPRQHHRQVGHVLIPCLALTDRFYMLL